MKDLDAATIEVVNDLFIRMAAIFPAFKQSWPSETEFRIAKREWCLALMEAGISSLERIEEGFSKLRRLNAPFVPSVGQFIAMCKMPSYADVDRNDLLDAPQKKDIYRQEINKMKSMLGILKK